MNWKALKDCKCPKCGGDLSLVKPIFTVDTYTCTKCDFKIRIGKFEEIINSMYAPKKKNWEIDNFEALQNL